MRVTYHNFGSETQESEACAAFEKVKRVAPWHVEEIRIVREPGDDNCATVLTQTEHRYMEITLYDGFFRDKPDDQALVMLEEIIHGIVAPFFNWTRDNVVSLFDEDERLCKVLQEEAQFRNESITADLVHVMGGLLGIEVVAE